MVTSETFDKIITKSNEHFGLDNRLIKISEECAELIQAIAKYQLLQSEGIKDLNKKKVVVDHICDEIADVEIVLASLKKYLPQNILNKYKTEKIERLSKRINFSE